MPSCTLKGRQKERTSCVCPMHDHQHLARTDSLTTISINRNSTAITTTTFTTGQSQMTSSLVVRCGSPCTLLSQHVWAKS
jgi:hypothetical protein